jgi:acetyl-CoA carboxylase carboxyl transferase subunit alpha
MTLLNVPIVGIIIGEGGSGGALGIAIVDRLLVQQHAYYSVIPPEGCAAILWRDRKYSEEAANALKLGAKELLSQGIADEVIEEPLGGAHRDPAAAAESIRDAIARHLGELRETLAQGACSTCAMRKVSEHGRVHRSKNPKQHPRSRR